jgi:hypothetical protein
MKKNQRRPEPSDLERLKSEISKIVRIRQIALDYADSREIAAQPKTTELPSVSPIPCIGRRPRKQPWIVRQVQALYGFQKRPRNGKIARLPEPARQQINQMLEDGVPYRAILKKLQDSSPAPLSCALSEMNLSNWFRGGYQDRRTQQQDNALLVSLQSQGAPAASEPSEKSEASRNNPNPIGPAKG